MSKTKEALEMARTALESERAMGKDSQGNYTIEVTPVRILEAIKAIDEALAEQQGEPVATVQSRLAWDGRWVLAEGANVAAGDKLYTHPAPEAPAPSQQIIRCASTVAGENSTERAKVWFPYSFYAEKKLKESAPCQQAAQTALAWMRPSIYAECQPETTTLREIADEWIAEGHVVTALGPLSHAAPWQELSRDETQRALMECERNAASDEYFKTRPQIDTTDRRRVFAAAFDRAWKARLPTVRDSTTETLAALRAKNGGAA